MNVILRHIPAGEPSATRLFKRMVELGVGDLHIVEYYHEIKKPADFLIRWGSTERFPINNPHVVINTAASIRNGDQDKVEGRRILATAGVSIPRTFFSKDEILQAHDVHYPLIGRLRHHGQGNNIEFLENRSDVRGSVSAYWSEFIPKEREFRTYVFGNEVIGVAEKIPKSKTDVAWNSHLGSTFVDVPTPWNFKMIKTGVAAAKAIGQHFSGVDLMELNGQFYVLEVNTAVALSNPHRVDIFARAFRDAIDRFERTGHL